MQLIEPGPFMKFRRQGDEWVGSFDLELFEYEALGPTVQHGRRVQFYQRSKMQHPSRNWIIGVDVTVSKST